MAERTPFSASAAARHWRNHVRASLTLATDVNKDNSSPSDFATRLMGLADDAARLRQHARTSGNSSLLIRALAAEQSAVTTLMSRLGIDDSGTIEVLTNYTMLVAAIVEMVNAEPRLGTTLADALDNHGATEIASDVRAMTQRVQSRLRLVSDPTPDGSR